MKRGLARAFLVFVSVLGFSSVVHADTSSLAGWAWSSNVGWISFSCNNTSSCSTSNYGVVEAADGTLSGYAWSSNVGWIQFGGLSGFPSGTGTYSQNAAVVSGSLRGWAKALAADGNGWDGWISLSGNGYGVSQSGSSFSGYAWGSSVLGWIRFDAGTDNVRLSGDVAFDVQNSTGGSSISGQSVPYNTVPKMVWTMSNVPSVSCSVSKKSTGGTSFATVSGITASGSTTGNALADGDYTFGIDCTNPAISKQVSFTVLPQAPSFSLGADTGVRVQVVGNGGATSEQDTTFIAAVGGYSSLINVSISSFPTAPASTTFSYSLDGGAHYSANPGSVPVASPYTSGVPFKMKVTRAAGAPAMTSPFAVQITGRGTDSSQTTSTKTITVTPVNYAPQFEEL